MAPSCQRDSPARVCFACEQLRLCRRLPHPWLHSLSSLAPNWFCSPGTSLPRSSAPWGSRECLGKDLGAEGALCDVGRDEPCSGLVFRGADPRLELVVGWHLGGCTGLGALPPSWPKVMFWLIFFHELVGFAVWPFSESWGALLNKALSKQCGDKVPVPAGGKPNPGRGGFKGAKSSCSGLLPAPA